MGWRRPWRCAGPATASGCAPPWRSTSGCSPPPWPAACCSTRWRCSRTPGTCSPTSGPSSSASWLQDSPPAAGGSRRTFGFHRGEVLAALVNGIALVVLAVLIVVAAIGRLSDPPEVDGTGVLVIGLVGPRRQRLGDLRPRARRAQRHQPRGGPAPFRGRRPGLDRRGRLGDRVPGLRLARGGPDREPRDRRPDPRLLGAPHPRAVRRADGERPAGRGRRGAWAARSAG